MSKPKKLPIDELLRLACIYAERDQQAFVEATCDSPSDAQWYQEAMDFVKQVREYRLKRWGRTASEALTDGVPLVNTLGLHDGHQG